MIKKIAILITSFLSLLSLLASAQNVTIRGTMSDASTGEQLLYGTVYDTISKKGTTSNYYGFYSLTLPAGKVRLIYSYVGYARIVKELSLSRDTVIEIHLSTSNQLKEVVVTNEISSVKSTQMGKIDIPVSQVKKMPVMFGETDLLKTLQLMPGVKGGSEGTAGIYVRGGGPDQNLILLDGVPVYNVNHLFGFFSVFNAEAIQNVSLLKGGFPARYGGRLSSVVDIKMKEGNNKKFKAVASIGLVASQFTFEGPIKNEKTSYILSFRRTYIDALTYPIQKAVANEETGKFLGGYYFYDVNAKINHSFSSNSRLYFSVYTGKDRFFFNQEGSRNIDGSTITNKVKTETTWGNITAALRWNYIISNKLFQNTTITYSRYRFLVGASFGESISGLNASSQDYKFEYNSGINDIAVKEDFDFIPNANHYIRFGANATYHTFNPGINVFEANSGNASQNIDTSFGNTAIPALEISAYAEDDWSITEKLKVNAGLHYSAFSLKNQYYHSLQPRLAARYLISDKISVKASYVHMTQYIHLLTNSSMGLPTDLWVPATAVIKPQKAIMYALGTDYQINKMFDLSVEGYYKEMFNLIEYKEGASFFSIDNSWENKVTTGKGWSYGAEVLFKKNTGKLTGWIGYTLAWTNRQFAEISYGRIFPYRYDRRHDIGIVAVYSVSDRVDLSGTWVYGTGLALTLPEEKYLDFTSLSSLYGFNGGMIEHFDYRNSYRMPSYHRLDLGINLNKKIRWGKRTWSFGAYNVYNRQNPFYVHFDYDKNGNKVLKQLSLFPIIPYFKYTIYFE